MNRAIVNIDGMAKEFICYGCCIFSVPESECNCGNCEEVHHFYGGLEYMIKAGWGIVKNSITAYNAQYMCPECLEKYGDNS